MLKHSIKAITGLLKANYPAIPVENAEKKEPSRPSFYIKVVTAADEQTTPFVSTELITLDVVYFSASSYEGYKDLLTKKNELRGLLSQLININGVYKAPERLEFNINKVDYILNTLLSFELPVINEVKDIDDINEQLIENLEYVTELNK